MSQPQCCADIHRHTSTWNITSSGVRVFEMGQCSRKAKRTLINRRGEFLPFCEQHACLAREGFVDERGEMPSPHAMADYRKYADSIHSRPPYGGLWRDPLACDKCNTRDHLACRLTLGVGFGMDCQCGCRPKVGAARKRYGRTTGGEAG